MTTRLLSAALALACALTASAAVSTPVAAAGRSAARPQNRLVTIRMDIDFKPHVRSSFGRISGYDPVEAHVRVGDRIQWVNPDDQVHTATGMAYTGDTVPSHYTFQGDYTKPHGRIIDASEWSTGNVAAHGGKSPVFVAKRPGHYFYACGYHIGIGQVGVIVVGP